MYQYFPPNSVRLLSYVITVVLQYNVRLCPVERSSTCEYPFTSFINCVGLETFCLSDALFASFSLKFCQLVCNCSSRTLSIIVSTDSSPLPFRIISLTEIANWYSSRCHSYTNKSRCCSDFSLGSPVLTFYCPNEKLENDTCIRKCQFRLINHVYEILDPPLQLLRGFWSMVVNE